MTYRAQIIELKAKNAKIHDENTRLTREARRFVATFTSMRGAMAQMEDGIEELLAEKPDVFEQYFSKKAKKRRSLSKKRPAETKLNKRFQVSKAVALR